MCSFVSAFSSQNILELGCGDGSLLVEIALKKRKEIRLIGVDLVEEMCSRAHWKVQTVGKMIEKQKLELGNNDSSSQRRNDQDILGYYEEIHNSSEPGEKWLSDEKCRHISNMNTEIWKGSADALTEILPDNSIDTIVSCLTLHIVPDPTKMLRECMRVLKPQGKAIFSVHGDKSHSFQHLLYEESIKAVNAKSSSKKDKTAQETSHDSWHLADHSKLANLLQSTGFSDVLCWEQFHPEKWRDPSQLRRATEHMLAVRWEDKSTFQAAVNYVTARQKQILEERKLPIGLSCAVAFGIKR